MVRRDTATGLVLERMIIPSLDYAGYQYELHVNIGKRFGGGKHIIDVVAVTPQKEKILISLKWQQVSGTAEQKVPFEAMCLAEAISNNRHIYKKAYLVLGGSGWKLRDFFVNGGLERHLSYSNLVDIITFEDFIAKANRNEL